MLILTRRIAETLMIDDDVTITVLGVEGNQVRLGIKAPKSIQVHREEIFNRIQQENATGAKEAFDSDIEYHLGTVAYIKDDKGYGFIYAPGIDDNLFFHASSLINLNFSDLGEGSDVNFKIAHNEKGRVAVEIQAA